MGQKDQSFESIKTGTKNRIPHKSFRYFFLVIILVQLLSVLVLRFIGNSMYPFFITVYFWIACYIVFVAILVAESDSQSIVSRLALKPYHYLILVVGLTALFRLALIGSEVSISLDPEWYLDFGKFMKQGKMPYADFYFPYPPVFAYFIYPLSLLFPLVDSFRLLASFFDVLIVIVLWKISNREQDNNLAELIPLWYALFPLSIIESGFNGHFESIANLFLLLGIFLVLHMHAKSGGAFLGLSAATKLYAAFLLPIFVPFLKTWRKRLEFIITALFVAAFSFIPLAMPVWMRGDFVLPGFSIPGSTHEGFIGSLLDSLPLIDPVQLTISLLIATGALAIVLLFGFRMADKIRIRKSLSYDILTLLLGIVFLAMALIAAVYPFTVVSLFVFWRYPADIGIVRGVLTIVGALLLVKTVWKRWKETPQREVNIKYVIILASTTLLILVSLFTDVFYGWYLLWCIPSLFLLRDRKVLVVTLVCLLAIYPGYTHDNFTSLGMAEDKFWAEDFDTTLNWQPPHVLNADEWEGNLNVLSRSKDGIGLFSIEPSGSENRSALEGTRIEWDMNMSVSADSQAEFVVRLSVNWDPTFERYADVAIRLAACDAQGQAVNGTLLPRNYSPTNLTFVLYRRAFVKLQNVSFPITLEKISLIIYPLMIEDIVVYIDSMYLTEYKPMGQIPYLLIPLLLGPNVCAVYLLRKRLDGEE